MLIMARDKQHHKNDANTGTVPQEFQHRWHQSVRNLPSGQMIDIPYLKQLAMKEILPIAYCKIPDIDKVENFVPAYLQRFTRKIWPLLDAVEIFLSQHNWDDDRDDSIIKLFGTFMQHLEDDFVIYFGGPPVAASEEGQPLFKEGSPRCSPGPRKNQEQRSLAPSLMKTPYCGCAAGTQCKAPPSANIADSPHSCWGCNKKIHSSLWCGESILNLLSKNPSYTCRSLSNGHLIQEDDNNETRAICFTCIALLLEACKLEEAQKLNARISDMLAVPPPTGINMTTAVTSAAATVMGIVVARPATTETTAVATTAVATKTASNDNANPQSNVQAHPRKVNYRQLPLNKHMPSTVYYHAAFRTYPRHNRPENVASTPAVLDTLMKAFSSRARVDSQKNWNCTVASWTSSKNKLSILSLPPLIQESNVGNDGLMSQSTFDMNIKEDDYLAKLCPDPHLFISSMPSDDQLKK